MNQKRRPLYEKLAAPLKTNLQENHIMERNTNQFPRTSIIDFVNTITFDDCTFFDFTEECPHRKTHTSDILPLPRGGDFLHLLDLVNAPVMEEGEVGYWVTGVIHAWHGSLVTIEDASGTFHYTTLEALEEASQLIAPAIVTEGIIRVEKEWIEYVSSIETPAA
jgi:hypothetical protein